VTVSDLQPQDVQRAKNRRLALLCGLVAVGFYVAFIVVSYWQGRH
jgi:hypothetical protein